MFRNIFSFNGRIRRTEYWLTAILIQFVLIPLVFIIGGATLIGFILIIAPLWISLGAGVKRSHDLGNSGWLILIPLYNPLFLAFAGSQPFTNKYGANPKGLEMSSHTPPVVINNFLNNPEVVKENQVKLLPDTQESPIYPLIERGEEKTIGDKIGDVARSLASSAGKVIDKGIKGDLASETKKISHLKELKELLDLGILTQEEYDQQKIKILNNS